MSSGAMFCLTSTVESQDILTILGLSRDCNCTRIPEQVVHLQCGSVSLYTGVTLTVPGPSRTRPATTTTPVAEYPHTPVVVAGLVPGWSRDCQSNSGVWGYSATGVVVVAGLV